MSDPERKVNDVGGLRDGSLQLHERDATLFEKRVDALVMLLVNPQVGAFRVDALRRAIEQNTPEDYAQLGYYQKWIRAVRALLLEQEILTEAEVTQKLAEVRARKAGGKGA